MGIFDRFVFVGATASILGALIYFRREKKFSKMMNDVDKMSVIEFDRVIDTSQLPEGQMVAIRCTVKDEKTRKGLTNPNQAVLLSSIIQYPAQHMFNSSQGFSFSVDNPQGLSLNVQKPQGAPTILFDLHKISKELKYDDFYPRAPLSLHQRYLQARGQLKFAEFAILPNEQYIFVGKILNVQSQKPSLSPRIIMGDEKIKFLKNLDLYLAKNSQKGKNSIAAAFGFVAIHLALTSLFPETFKSRRRHQ